MICVSSLMKTILFILYTYYILSWESLISLIVKAKAPKLYNYINLFDHLVDHIVTNLNRAQYIEVNTCFISKSQLISFPISWNSSDVFQLVFPQIIFEFLEFAPVLQAKKQRNQTKRLVDAITSNNGLMVNHLLTLISKSRDPIVSKNAL